MPKKPKIYHWPSTKWATHNLPCQYKLTTVHAWALLTTPKHAHDLLQWKISISGYLTAKHNSNSNSIYTQAKKILASIPWRYTQAQFASTSDLTTYILTDKSPTELPRAAPPSSQGGCAKTLDNPYYKRVPLPKITGYQKLGQEERFANMVHITHWHETILRNSVLISRNLARYNKYGND